MEDQSGFQANIFSIESPPRLFSQTESNSAPSSHVVVHSEKRLLSHEVEEESPTSTRERRPVLLDFGDMSSEEEEADVQDGDKERDSIAQSKISIEFCQYNTGCRTTSKTLPKLN